MGGQTHSTHASITQRCDTVIMSTKHVLGLASQWHRVETQDFPKGRSAVACFSVSVPDVSIV